MVRDKVHIPIETVVSGTGIMWDQPPSSIYLFVGIFQSLTSNGTTFYLFTPRSPQTPTYLLYFALRDPSYHSFRGSTFFSGSTLSWTAQDSYQPPGTFMSPGSLSPPSTSSSLPTFVHSLLESFFRLIPPSQTGNLQTKEEFVLLGHTTSWDPQLLRGT